MHAMWGFFFIFPLPCWSALLARRPPVASRHNAFTCLSVCAACCQFEGQILLLKEETRVCLHFFLFLSLLEKKYRRVG